IQQKKNQINPSSGEEVTIKMVKAVRRGQKIGWTGILLGADRTPVVRTGPEQDWAPGS
ncbi:hypothetical protein ACLOJK_008332, partial [Asimina triloba]